MGEGWKRVFLCLAASLVVVNADKAKRAVPNDAADLTSDHTVPKTDGDSSAVLLTKWLDSVEGGFFDARQEVKAVVTAGGSTFHGIFAKEFIAKDSLLAQIPWEFIVNDEESDESLSENDVEGAVLKCGTARNLAREMKQVQTLGKYIKDPHSASKYGPYIQYLLDQPLGAIPSEWSVKGKAMLNELLGGSRRRIPPSYATTWLEEDWFDECNGDPKDDLGSKAAMIVVSRADDDLLVPVYDMYNHRNGKWYNSHTKVTRGVNYQMTARRDIQPGEQIYNSYNMCDTCGGRKDTYGTGEIFRDYGFVEDFPQRWNFEDLEFMIDLSESEEDGEIEVVWASGEKPKTEEDKEGKKRSIMREIRRLVKKRGELWKSNLKDGKSTIPDKEWSDIWEYHQSIVNALAYAFNDIVEEDSEKIPVDQVSCTADGVCDINYFHELNEEKDSTKYNVQTCNNKEIMRFPDYFMLEGLKTHYQQLNFAFSQEDGDICMDLEDTVQICSSYRPHYHEFSSHFAARFVDNVKNVVFVGGGDSMMLHEVLKYPSLEKVVGLELDQVVVRKSFKYFHTQPHFDNDKVEWWFGDATKSLLLLPKDYWGSFDLVIVDLSETVMAFSVTEELDVFDALALLLNPDGVMVKNEHYMDTMSETFDYTLQVYLDQNPKICSQCMIFGSNKADFFHKPLVEHGVETLLLEPVNELEDEYKYFHDVRRNDAMKQGKCNLNTQKKNETEQKKSAGLLHILDAEDLGVSLDKETVEKAILAAAKKIGFTKIEPNNDKIYASAKTKADGNDEPKSTMVNLVFEEGYVTARIYPEYKYAAVDLGVWGSFQNGDEFRKLIAEELKTKTPSFFRVVVGGMFNSTTWEQEKDLIGPQVVQQRNCEESTKNDNEFTDDIAKRTIIDEAINVVDDQDFIAVVFCGIEGVDECLGLDVLKEHTMVSKVIPVWACPELSSTGDKEEYVAKMTKCESEVVGTLIEGRGFDGDGIVAIVLDGSAPYEMGIILHSILTVDEHRDHLIEDDHYVLSLSNNPQSEKWRVNLLEIYRQHLLYDPVKFANYDITVGGASTGLAIVSYHAGTVFSIFKSLEDNLTKRLASSGVEASAEVTAITGGLFQYQHDFDPQEFLQEEYPEEPGKEQWKDQKSFGRKTVVQYELDTEKESNSMFDEQAFVQLVDSTITGKGGIFDLQTYTDVGDGLVIIADGAIGSVILVWDGREHVDLNIFLHDDTELEITEFLAKFEKLVDSKLNMTLRDDFPRGIGRVMNFQEDMTYNGIDSVSKREPYVDLD